MLKIEIVRIIKSLIRNSILFDILSLICIFANIIHTHQEIIQFTRPWYVLYPSSHVCFLIFEGSFVYFLSFIWPKRRHLLLLILYYITTIILWINVAYFRYFDTYMPLTLYGEFNNLKGLLPDIINSFKCNDFFFAITTCFITIAYKKCKKSSTMLKQHYILPTILVVTLLISFAHHYNGIRKDYDYISEFFKDIDDKRTTWDIFVDRRNTLANNDPKTCTFYYGIGLSLIWEAIDETLNSERYIFTESERKEIKLYYQPASYALPADTINNLIFIIVESLSSFPINKTYGGVELTPNLNKLITEAYYNPRMISEAQLGQSSDGQFIYLTGLLPLKMGVTINSITAKKIHTFVSMIKKENNNFHSQMIIPTDDDSWSQKSMCAKYGINNLYSIKDYPGKIEDDWMNDKQLFEFAKTKDNQLSTPFINFILTSSMHSPYTHSCENYGIEYPSKFSPEVKHYLDNVHYMDKYLGLYIKSLQERPWYKNSTIIITADHKPNGPKLNTKDVSIFEDIPLIIINPSNELCNLKEDCPIMQTSIFPTLLDMYHIKSKWRGVGKSIFMPDSVCNNEHEKNRFGLREKISNYIISQFYIKQLRQDHDTIINWMH